MECNIIIPVWNQLNLTKDCIESIIKNTSAGYRIVVIDNASDDKTKTYLESLRNSKGDIITLVQNQKNAGFIKAVNQGMELSRAPYLCLLNNDTIVTSGWLETMISVAQSSKDIGIVNPSSNNLGQRPASGESIDAYAEKLKVHRAQFVELGAAIGFCMLIKKEVIEKVGFFDEVYGMGNFEDTDFSRKAVKEGYKCVRACGAYVYHRENSSFKKLKNFDDDFKRNKEIFEFRWGKPKRAAYILDLYSPNILKRIGVEALKMAREGSWVWIYSKDIDLAMPEHSNIIYVKLPEKKFYWRAVFRVLKKKKKFDDIFVQNDRLGKILEYLSVFHKAKIKYD